MEHREWEGGKREKQFPRCGGGEGERERDMGGGSCGSA